MSQPVPEAEAERHATNLELFLDLVFVFAVTQIASTMASDLTWASVGRGLLISWLVWWQWSQYTWAGAAVDLQRAVGRRVLVLSTIPSALLVAAAIPRTFHETGPWFGIAYLLTQLLVLAMQGSTALQDENTRRAFVRYVSVAAVMPVVVAVGGYLPGPARLVAWCIAGALNVVSAYRGGSGEWSINPVHFAERHALFVIISLGEALVAIGASATEAGLTARITCGLVVAAALAGLLWWSYFAYLPNVTEHQLRLLPATQRGVMARTLFTFGHFPLVSGILFFAIAARHMVADPFAHLATGDRALLVASLACLFGGYLHIQWRVVRALARERLVAIPAIAALAAAGGAVPGVVVFGVVGAVVFVTQAITWRNFRSGVHRDVTPNL